MRTCSKCQASKPESDFASKSSKSKHSYCKECQRTYNRDHYARNKGTYIERADRRKKRVRAEVEELKRVPCKDCGRTYHPWQMDFDHIGDVR